jgi:hypothetical protein
VVPVRGVFVVFGLLVALSCGPSSENGQDDGSDGGSAGDDATEGEVDCEMIGPGEGTVAPGPVGPLGYPTRHCNPRSSGSGEHVCCSDDPAAENGGLPEYLGKAYDGEIPIFSGQNNMRGTSGMCVRTDDIPSGAGLLDPGAESCPIPCNPTWASGNVTTVCGPNRRCCQTRAIGERDCIVGSDGRWRPVTGEDIPEATNWSNERHDTHQDPGGTGCMEFANGDISSPVYGACVDQLTVANQRGYCMSLAPGELCPAEDTDYLDACDQLNQGG